MRIAQRFNFNAGSDRPIIRPEGTAESNRPRSHLWSGFSAVPSGLGAGILPRVETRGYCRLSLRDTANGSRFYNCEEFCRAPRSNGRGGPKAGLTCSCDREVAV
jgi:hypothetical protein